MNRAPLLALVASIVLSGCSTFEKLDTSAEAHARETMAMLAELSTSSSAFRAKHGAEIAAMNGTLANEMEANSQPAENLAVQKALSASVGDPGAKFMAEKLGTLLAAWNEAEGAKARSVALAAETRRLIKPLPASEKSLAATREALAKLIEGPSRRVRVEELQAIFEAAKKARDDAQAAASSAASAPQQ